MERIEYNKADKRQAQAIVALLTEAFGDYPMYYAMQLAHLADPQRTILYGTDPARPIAHIQIADYILYPQNERVAYLFAVCTKEEHRGEGVMQTLLTDLLGGLRRQGYAFAVLLPASESLRGYYQRRFHFHNGGHCRPELPMSSEGIYPAGATKDYLTALKPYETESSDPLPDYMYYPLNKDFPNLLPTLLQPLT